MFTPSSSRRRRDHHLTPTFTSNFIDHQHAPVAAQIQARPSSEFPTLLHLAERAGRPPSPDNNMHASIGLLRPRPTRTCTRNALARRGALLAPPALSDERRRAQSPSTGRRWWHDVVAKAAAGGDGVPSSPAGRPAVPEVEDAAKAAAAASGGDGGNSGGKDGGGGKDDGRGGSDIDEDGGGSDDDDGKGSDRPTPQRPRWYAAWVWATALAYLAWRFDWRRRRREAAAAAEAEQRRHAEAVEAWDAFRWARSPLPRG